jgi:formylglycine-generating enzyme required for sulfatase activity
MTLIWLSMGMACAQVLQPVPAAPPPPVVEPEPEPEPPPPPPMLPDGTLITPCAGVPEGMVCVPGGEFSRGHDGPDACDQPENPRSPVNHQPTAKVAVQTFYMDTTEVIYAAYKACEASAGCPSARPWYKDFDRPTQPMLGVSWYDADRACRAMGKHLPTEAEWELSARGPDGELTPFGSDPVTCEQAVIKDERGRSCGVQKQFGQAHKGRTLEVGSRPAGRYGLFDMVGNAEEWVADWYTRSFEECGADCLGVNPRGPCGGEPRCSGHRNKLVKGGSWYWPSGCATGYNRRPHVPSNKPYHHFGFRCAASAEEAALLTTPPIEAAK